MKEKTHCGVATTIISYTFILLLLYWLFWNLRIGVCVCVDRYHPEWTTIHAIPTTPTHTDKITYCESLAMKTEMTMILDLPVECRNMERVQKVMQEKRAKVDPFAGMSGAHKVKGNYVKGQETHHQIQRRLTTGATIGQRRFSKLDK